MLRVDTAIQPSHGAIGDLVGPALTDSGFTECRAAVAYITTSGVRTLEPELAASKQRRSWLAGIDWCRSDPPALEALDRSARSSVRIFRGEEVIARPSCNPRTPYHPKGILFSAPDRMQLISGSANLSRSGIRTGIEIDTVVEVANPSTKAEQAVWDRLDDFRTWFDREWTGADQYRSLAARYRKAFEAAPKTLPLTDDDHAARPPSGSAFTSQALVALRRAELFWIQTGKMTAGGSTSPSHQLMMRALTRVFFGFEPDEVPRKSPIGTVDIDFAGAVTTGLTLEFAHNGMDRLNLPALAGGTSAVYDGETLIFGKLPGRDKIYYSLSLASAAEKRSLKARSRSRDWLFTMTVKGREFGFL